MTPGGVVVMKPEKDFTMEELEDFIKWTQTLQPDAVRIMRENGLIIDDLHNPMQKLAFTFYTMLVELDRKSHYLWDGEE